MKITTKQITTTAVLLAICIVSQFFKNTSVYITGPIINACLIIAALDAGMACGIILSVITPVTSFLITGSHVSNSGDHPMCYDRKYDSRGCRQSACKEDQGQCRTDRRYGSRQYRKSIIYGNRDRIDLNPFLAPGSNGT